MTAVASGVVVVDHGDLLPGQGVELTGLAALVVLDGQQVVSAAFAQVGGVVALGVEGIGGNDHSREIRVVINHPRPRRSGQTPELWCDPGGVFRRVSPAEPTLPFASKAGHRGRRM
nr:hypothetical protein [Streptomyces sp. 142MFCol3.1]